MVNGDPVRLRLRYVVVDVFAQRPLSGNQLAVFLVDDGNWPSEREMLSLAREIGYSESTFVARTGAQRTFAARIFSPVCELPFAGHPVIGSAFVASRYMQSEIGGSMTGEPITIEIASGAFQVVEDAASVFWMNQPTPRFGSVVPKEHAAQALGVPAGAIRDDLPVIEATNGLGVIIIPLTDLDSLSSARVSGEHYHRLIRRRVGKLLLPFTDQAYFEDQDLAVRVMGGYYGVPEDPATGSANGSLAAYMHRFHYGSTSTSLEFRVGQGVEIGRPSLLISRVTTDSGGVRVQVGGQVHAVAEARLVL